MASRPGQTGGVPWKHNIKFQHHRGKIMVVCLVCGSQSEWFDKTDISDAQTKATVWMNAHTRVKEKKERATST